MAPPTQLQKDLYAVQLQVARLEERIEPKKGSHSLRNTIIGVVGVALIGWVGWVSNSIATLNARLVAGGNTQIVAELKSPKSPQQLQATISTVIAQIQNARLEKTRPDPTKIAALSGALADVVTRDPSVDQGWRAAAELISYRSTSSEGDREAPKDCAQNGNESIFFQPRIVSPNQLPINDASFYWHDCTLRLDDNPILKDSIATKEFQGGKGNYVIYLQNIHVVYSGGVIPEFDTIVFRNCTFSFVMPQIPPPSIQKLTTTLLAANNLGDVTVKFQS